jgi:hypothetical protein
MVIDSVRGLIFANGKVKAAVRRLGEGRLFIVALAGRDFAAKIK